MPLQKKKTPSATVVLGLILLAVGIGYVGHQGGKLTWKASHYDELFEVIDQFAPGLIPQEEPDDEGTINSGDGDVEDLKAEDSMEEEVEASFN